MIPLEKTIKWNDEIEFQEIFNDSIPVTLEDLMESITEINIIPTQQGKLGEGLTKEETAILANVLVKSKKKLKELNSDKLKSQQRT